MKELSEIMHKAKSALFAAIFFNSFFTISDIF